MDRKKDQGESGFYSRKIIVISRTANSVWSRGEVHKILLKVCPQNGMFCTFLNLFPCLIWHAQGQKYPLKCALLGLTES